ncbi:hypothetical protein SAMN04488041_10279 [Sulfitobacter pontiacus]|uniref:Uncharacterized protein n=1 Tax=Sulfitobacter pontiacus TaxID=60137 RepID=A0A1H2T7I4_9RHOB|nr:hypothetical protein SAMN04488041_10279 [Sulfitobacter pontiacus]
MSDAANATFRAKSAALPPLASLIVSSIRHLPGRSLPGYQNKG